MSRDRLWESTTTGNQRKSSLGTHSLTEHDSSSTSDHETRYSKKEGRISFAVAETPAELESKLTPFNLVWSYGYNKNIPILNLTKINSNLIFYASAHAGVLYDYKKREMHMLQGHHNAVSSIASDTSGKWIVTADAGNDNVVIVWDSDLRLPTRTVFNPHPEGTRVVGLSPNAKYVVSVSDNVVPTIALWLWTFGEEKPNATHTLEMGFGKVNHITFNPDNPDHFILTSSNRAAFLTWDSNKQTLSSCVPENLSGKAGRFVESTYLPEMRQALTCTTKGFVEVWMSEDEEDLSNNSKSLYKELRLQIDGITSMRCINSKEVKNEYCRNVIVMGNSQGHIRFYDNLLRLLYWCQKFDLDSIVGISFPLFDSTIDSTKSSKQRLKANNESGNISKTSYRKKSEVTTFHDRSVENELTYKRIIPSDASLTRRPFLVHDFIVSTTKAQIGLVNFLHNTLESIAYLSEAPITAMDTHRERPYLAVGNVIGQISVYNHEDKTNLISSTLPINKTGSAIAVQSLKYTPSGLYLITGMADGTLWILNPSTLVPLTSFHNTTGAITKICISEYSKYITHMDTNMCVSLYYYDIDNHPTWEYLGKQRCHYKPVRDIMFGEHDDSLDAIPQLFSLGEDRMLVEYDIKNSKPDDLKILNSVRIEQSATPYCMAWYPRFTPEKFLLIANSEFKYKIINSETSMCRKTTLSPLFGSPVLQMKVLHTAHTQPEQKAYMIIACEQQIGIQLLPTDGNPFKSVGVIGHPNKLLQMCFDPHNKIMYTIGLNDATLLMWEINERAVDVMARIGGEGIKPYCGLIEGGMTGWLFEEMQDLFYYAQILHQGDSMATTRQVNDKIPLCELPDLMRAVGYYPSEYEIENMLCEVNLLNSEESKKKEDSIRFEDFVCLYVNHHPAYGIYAEKLQDAFTTFADSLDGENSIFTRDRFLHVLQSRGERFSEEETLKYLNTLLVKNDNHRRQDIGSKERVDKPQMNTDEDQFIDVYNGIPGEFTYRTFADEILGIIYQIPPDETPEEEPTN